MALNPINVKLDNSNRKTSQQKVSFKGVDNPAVLLMDCINRGGYFAEFFGQDLVDFMGPRTVTGVFRNYDETHELNWEFAASEAGREILSGPPMGIIPWVMLFGAKKCLGTANDVPIKYIQIIGDDFAKFASTQSNFANKDTLKQNYYKEAIKNALANATKRQLNENELETKAKYFTDKILKIENTRKKKNWFKKFLGKRVEGSNYDLLSDLADEFAALRKKYGGSLIESNNLEFTNIAKDKQGEFIKTEVNFKKFLKYLKNYTDDVTKKLSTEFKGGPSSVKEFVDKFNHKRVSSRFILIAGMDLAVAAFLTITPELYKQKNGNPGLKGLKVEDDSTLKTPSNTEQKDEPAKINNESESGTHKINEKQPSFGFKLSDKLLSGGMLRKFSDAIEYDGFSMSIPSTTGILAYIVYNRAKKSYDKYDRYENLRRDGICITIFLFLARALSKGFSEICQKISGFVLNQKPEGFNKLGTKIWNYINPLSAFSPLNSEQIISKYSNIDDFKNGIVDFCEFINKKGGNINKVLSKDNTVKTNTEEILGKALESATYDEIVNAFKNAKTEAMKEIYKVFKSPNNPFVKRAKTMNSLFWFISTFMLTPALIIWVAKSNEAITKKRIAKEAAEKEAKKANASKPVEAEKAA